MTSLTWPPTSDVPEADPEQKRAAEILREHGKLIVEAAPGTGKTYLGVYLALCGYRLGWVSKQQPALFLTFSRNARVQIENEIADFRDKGWLSDKESSSTKIANYHAFFFEILRRGAGIWGCKTVLRPATFSEQRQRIKDALAQSGAPGRQLEKAVNQADLVFGLKRFGLEDLMSPDETPLLDEDTYRAVCDAATAALRSGRPYYDDFAPLFLNLLEHRPELTEWLHLTYPLVILDEFQDTDPVQYQILLRIQPKRIVILYDRYQMIYGWRGSRIERPVQAMKDLSIPKAAKTELKTIHRVGEGSALARFIQQLRADDLLGVEVEDVKQRPYLLCYPIGRSQPGMPDEARCLARLRKHGIVNHQETTAILSRANYLAEYLHRHLRVQKQKWQASYACRWIGSDNNPDEVIRDHLYLLRKAPDAYSVRAWLGRLLDVILPASCTEVSFARELACDGSEILPNRRKESLVRIREGLSPWWDSVNVGNCGAIARALAEIETIAKLVVGETAYLDPDVVYYVRQLARAAATLHEKGGHGNWIEVCEHLEDSLVRSVYQRLRFPQHGLYVLTVHQSKGREFDHVIIPWLSSKGEPTKARNTGQRFSTPYCHDRLEDRRLLYVALTRARRRVTILYPEEDPSPFLRRWKLVV